MEENYFLKSKNSNLEKIRNDEVFVVSNKTEEELIEIANNVFNKLEDNGHPFSLNECKEELFSGDRELRPMGYAIYIKKGKLYIDSRNHRNDIEMKDKLEKVVLDLMS